MVEGLLSTGPTPSSSKRTLNFNGLEYCFRGLFVKNLTKSDFFRPIFILNMTFTRKLSHFAKCDKTALIINHFPWEMYYVGERYYWFLSNYNFATFWGYYA